MELLFKRYSGAAGILGGLILLSLATINAPDGAQIHRMSELGVYDESQWLFGTSMLVFAVAAFCFLRFYVEPRFKTSNHFRYLYYLATIVLILAVFVPANPDHQVLNAIHNGLIVTWGHAIGLAILFFTVVHSRQLPPDIGSPFFVIIMGVSYAVGLYGLIFAESLIAAQVFIQFVLGYWILRLTFLTLPTKHID